MAKRRKKSAAEKKRKVLGAGLFIVALLLLVSLVSHRAIDDVRIIGEVDHNLSPFEINYSNQGGMAGAYLSYFCLALLGWLAYFLPLAFVLISLRLFKSEMTQKLNFNTFLLFVISLLGTMIYNTHLVAARVLGVDRGIAGGYFTERLTTLAVKLVGDLGSYLILGGIVFILLMLYTSITPFLSSHLKLPGAKTLKAVYGTISRLIGSLLSFRWLKRSPRSEDDDEQDDEESRSEYGRFQTHLEEAEEDLPDEVVDDSDESDDEERPERKSRRKKSVTLKAAPQVSIKSINYTYPGLDLLKESPNDETSINADELNMTARMLKETLETFGISIEGEIEKYPGPIITRYEFKPGTGIKVNQIINLSDDLALALKAKRIRIIAPIPGKAAVGVEIPNRASQTVYLRDILSAREFQNMNLRLPLALGKTTGGKPFVTDLAKMPHLLIAGATGSGKSVCMNAVITSLLYRLHPHQVRFIFIDPKMLELSVYSGIPHLGRPVVTNPKRAEKVLADAVVEMEKRYRRLANVSVRNIVDFNNKQANEEDKLPYIVICVDELADLMMSTTSSKIEMLITRLAQMSRAVGIHLILATQRPSVDVITGLIKANFPSRIAFQVSSKVDSRTIIDANGAEKLLGSGDMLFLQTGQPEPVRIHGAYISSEETDSLVSFIKDQGIEIMALDTISQTEGEVTETEIDLGDPLFREACEVVIRHKQGSVSLLQRRLGIGYQRAARLIDKLEEAGVVSPFDGSKARDVLVDKTYLETIFASSDPGTHVKSE
jgi:S-DNA-T family DNA segregation ATPase FtsK/SpoIIIE